MQKARGIKSLALFAWLVLAAAVVVIVVVMFAAVVMLAAASVAIVAITAMYPNDDDCDYNNDPENFVTLEETVLAIVTTHNVTS